MITVNGMPVFAYLILVDQITKKLLKGKTTFEIAEDLEEPEENIRQLILEYNLMEYIIKQ